MTKQTPLVSVLTPSYNQARWLADNLRSVAAQTYPHIEHIVMDGGSNDGSVAVLESAPGIMWQSVPDGGQSNAINKAFRASSGDIIGWINSDDAYYSASVVEEVVRFFACHPDADVVYGHCAQLNARNTLLHILWVPPFNKRLLSLLNFIRQPAAFIRRSALTEPMVDETYGYVMDRELWLRLSRKHKFARLNKILAIDRLHSARKGVADRQEMLREREELALAYGGANIPLRKYVAASIFILFRWLGLTETRRALRHKLGFIEVDDYRSLIKRQALQRRRNMVID